MIDERIRAGLERQADLLRSREHAGGTQAGWKVGFGSPSGLTLLQLDGPIIGHLMDDGVLPDGSSVDVTGWTKPVIETEIACWISADVPAEIDAADASAYVGAVGPALEVADMDHPPEDVERILAGDIFHRGYVLGEARAGLSLAEVAGLTATVTHGSETLDIAEPEALTGNLMEVVARTALLAPLVARPLRQGDVILLGSIIPPRPVAPGDVVDYTLRGFPRMSLSFR